MQLTETFGVLSGKRSPGDNPLRSSTTCFQKQIITGGGESSVRGNWNLTSSAVSAHQPFRIGFALPTFVRATREESLPPDGCEKSETLRFKITGSKQL